MKEKTASSFKKLKKDKRLTMDIRMAIISFGSGGFHLPCKLQKDEKYIIMEKQFPEFSAVLFDMDGVIFDTEKVVVACWQEVAKKYGIPHIEDTCRKCLGLNQEATVRIFLDTYGEDFPYAAYKQESGSLFFGPYYDRA